jgi:hypothetical protein
MARPIIKIDKELVEKMASWGCKVTEIAEWFGCSDDTIHGRFSAELRKGKAALKTNLRQWQLKAASNGNVTMLIWLGKQLLDQHDKVEHFDGDAALSDDQLRDKIEAMLERKK